MKITLKYKDYGSTVRTRLLMDDSHVSSSLMSAKEFEIYRGILERGASNTGMELQVIEIKENEAKGPGDDAFLGHTIDD